jgi:hypothetical protein
VSGVLSGLAALLLLAFGLVAATRPRAIHDYYEWLFRRLGAANPYRAWTSSRRFEITARLGGLLILAFLAFIVLGHLGLL